MKLPRNYNRSMNSEPYSYDKVENAYFGIRRGLITNVYNLAGRLGQFYDVKLLDTGVILTGVKASISQGGFNGEGNYFAYDIDTPVLIAGVNGRLGQGDAYIVGTFTAEGEYDEFYKEGNFQDYGATQNGQLFNQPLTHPNKIAQEDAHLEVINIKNLDSAFDSPEFYVEGEERNAARGRPGIIKLDNRDGTSVHYTFDNNINYADGNLIFISGGTKETKADRFLSLAIRHINKANFAAGRTKISEEEIRSELQPKAEAPATEKETQNVEAITNSVTQDAATAAAVTDEEPSTTEEEAEETPTEEETVVAEEIKNEEEPQFRTLFKRTTNLVGFVLDPQTVSKRELQLAAIYCEAARKSIALNAGRLSAVGAMNAAFPGALQPTTGVSGPVPTVDGGFNPEQSSAPVAQGNFGERTSSNGVNNLGTNELPDMIIVLHETVKGLREALEIVNNSKKQASYHAIIDRSGEIINLVPPNKRAYGAEESKFNGEFYQTGDDPSVNAFAYQISLVTPPDGDNGNLTHSGYTDAQYRSLAWLISRTGIPESRVTTHKAVSNAVGRTDRLDPRSFDQARYMGFRNQFQSSAVIDFGV